MKSEVEVNMQVPSSSAKFNTDGRTDKRTKNLPTLRTSSPICNAREDDDFSQLGEVLDAGLWPTGERHPVIRWGERDEIPKHIRAAIFLRDRGRCCLCAERVQGEWHLDHIKPWSAGGSDLTDNLRVLCPTHNLERGNQVIPQESPALPATWWCSRCYSREGFNWEYTPNNLPICPQHFLGTHIEDGQPVNSMRCPVYRGYKAHREQTGEWPTWHERDPLTEFHTIAYCAHCNLRGLTGVTL